MIFPNNHGLFGSNGKNKNTIDPNLKNEMRSIIRNGTDEDVLIKEVFAAYVSYPTVAGVAANANANAKVAAAGLFQRNVGVNTRTPEKPFHDKTDEEVDKIIENLPQKLFCKIEQIAKQNQERSTVNEGKKEQLRQEIKENIFL